MPLAAFQCAAIMVLCAARMSIHFDVQSPRWLGVYQDCFVLVTSASLILCPIFAASAFQQGRPLLIVLAFVHFAATCWLLSSCIPPGPGVTERPEFSEPTHVSPPAWPLERYNAQRRAARAARD